MTEISDYTSSTALRAFFGGRTERATSRAFALETFVLDWAATGAVDIFKGPGPDPTTLTGYGSGKLWLRTNTGVNATAGSVRIWNGSSPASSESNWPLLTKALFLTYLGLTSSGVLEASYATRAAAAAATIDASKTYLVVNGFASVQDGGGGLYRKLGSTPSPVKLWHFQSVDGAYWELVPEDNVVSVKQLGAKGDDSTDDRAAIQAAMDYWAPFTTPAASGGAVFLPTAVYRVGASLDMTGYHGLMIYGSGPLATEIKATGNFPVFFHSSSSAAPLNKATIRGMTIRGGGNTNALAHGVSWTWANGCEISDVVFYGCYYGLYLSHQWQTVLSDLYAHGGGADRCNTGIYMAESDTSFVDNAVIASGCVMTQCIADGYRILNGQGSKWSSCEAGACNIGWNIGNVGAGPPPCEWMHFANCLGDSCTQYNFLLQKGSAPYVGKMSFVGTWSGNAGIHGIGISGGEDISFAGGVNAGNTQAAIYLTQCTKVVVSSMACYGNNESATAGVYDITISAGTYNVITGNTLTSQTGTQNFGEVAATDSNSIVGNSFLNGATIAGANTKCRANQGLTTSKNGSATLLNGTSSIVVTHGLAVTPTLDEIVLQARASMDAVGLKDLWVSAVGATTFTITANTNATGNLVIAWQARCKV